MYIVSNKLRSVLYIGATRNLAARVEAHQKGVVPGFTKKYQCYCLVHAEFYEDWNSAICREQQLKRWKREWKDNLITSQNPTWRDLSEDIP